MLSYNSLALMALAAVASAQNQPFNNGTGNGTEPHFPVAAAPAFVPGWEYLGCAAPPARSDYPGYTLASRSQNLTAETCATSCSSYAFFGLSGDSCYCSNAVQNGTTFQPDSQCSNRCPGNKNEACGRGGLLGPLSPLFRRQSTDINGGQLLSLYRQDIVPEGIIYIDISISIYIDVCPSGLCTLTYCEPVTRTGCGCPTVTTHIVPVTTTTAVCTVCGPETSTVTLTIPTGALTSTIHVGPVVPVGPTGTGPIIPIFTGGAVANGISGGLALVAGAIALL